MSVVEKSSNAIQKAKKIRLIIQWASTLSSPYLIGGIALILAIGLVILILFLPLLLLTDSEKLASQPYGSIVSDFPTQLDFDGMTYAWPVPTISRISSTFEMRDLFGVTKMHKGIDIANGAEKTELQPIYSMAAGKVIVAGAASGYGQAIYIDHGDGLRSIYGHLDTKMDVRPDQIVSKGQRIGRIGAGRVGRSTGAHLHFQIELNGTPVDPQKYVSFSDGGIGKPGKTPTEFSYKGPINIIQIKAFLDKRNSALADPNILAMIHSAGQASNVDPLFLLAITGQEQSFVPKNHNFASKMVNNPWNVYGCWCKGKGSTLTTEQSALVAAKTIVKLSANRPEGRNPIQWLSAKDNPKGYYAYDNNWWVGVSKFYSLLLSAGGDNDCRRLY